MSSFDVNVLSTKPVIREAANMNNDGGAGNLGYMSQGGKDDKNKKRQEESIFSKKENVDSFVYQADLTRTDDIEFSIGKFITEIIHSIKSLFKSR